MNCPCCSGKLHEEYCEPFHFKKEFPNVDYHTPLKNDKNGLPAEIAQNIINLTKLDGKN